MGKSNLFGSGRVCAYMGEVEDEVEAPAQTRAAFPDGPSVWRRVRERQLFAVDTPESLQRNADEFGDVSSFVTPRGQRQFQFNHPRDIQELMIGDASRHSRGVVLRRARGILGDGLLTSEDPLHLRQRRLAQPAFHRQRIAGYGDAIVQTTREMLEGWEGGCEIDAHREMVALTLRITSRCLLGTDVRPGIQTFVDAMRTFNEYLPYALLPFASWVEKLPVGPMPGMKRALTALDDLIYGIIREREASGVEGDDLLGMLLAARDDDGGMDVKQVRDEALTILMAGHETTASALTFALWLIAKHPEVGERMAAEVRAAVGARLPCAADYPRLGYVGRVFAESMRLYPPAWISARTATEDYTMRGVGFIPKGAALVCAPIVVHRDARWWPEPLRFDPERFTDAAKARRPKFAYFPFGGGTRQCIGEGFAWMEAVLALATVVRGWRLSLPEDAAEEMELLARFTIRPKHGVRVGVARRL